MRSGKLICKGCGLSFQVVTGRPVMMTSESIREWRSPVSEAMGVRSFVTFEESIKKFTEHEQKGVAHYMKSLKSPYKDC